MLPASLLALSLVFAPAAQKAEALTSNDLKALSWRSVGPANMGGRVSDVELASSDGKTFFACFGTGGLWKTTNRGTTFTPLFDHEATSSVGSIAVADAKPTWEGWREAAPDEKDPKKLEELGKARIIWLGTGEGNGRNSSSWGNGVYRSTDGGSSWKHLGLEDSKDIPQITVDPRDPDTCYVAALGHLWGPNKMRGIYKTTDAGKNWKPVLQIDENTGAIDVILDPSNPDTVYAAMYARRRTAYSFTSGGPEGGIYKSTDAGKTWRKLTNGLPSQTGRIGLDISKSNPKVIYAAVESDQGGGRNIDDDRSRNGGIFRSADGGETWTRVNAQVPRAFYFAKVRVDPKNEDKLFLLGYEIFKSEDGGRAFSRGMADKLHGDWHAMTIDPNDTDHLIVGSDGGLYQSFDGGATWDFLNSIAAGQFYNIAVDDSNPYRIAGGLQDNGSWLGSSSNTIEAGAVAITNSNWVTIGGGDGFHVAFDPTDKNVVYSESQGGWLARIDLSTWQTWNMKPDVKEGAPALRFNWNSPFFVSPHDSNVLYLGGNKVFKLQNKGRETEAISDDLSTKDVNKILTTGSAAETHGTIVALAESPVQKGLLWAGTDDGLVHITDNDGREWRNVTPKAVNGYYVANVEPSHHNKARAYLAIDGHRSENYDPIILETNDEGKSWQDVTGDLPKGNSVRVVREDLKNAGLLYCGTETGIYFSNNDGKNWIKLNQSSLPTVGVHDILQHPRTMDLIAATHGRSIWIMDDASPLSQLTPQVQSKEFHAFQSLPAMPTQRGWLDGLWGDKFFAAPNPPTGLRINYWVREKSDDNVSIKIANEKGQTVATLSGPANRGLNRVLWDMQPEAKLRLPNRGEEGTIYVPAGTYTATLNLGKNKDSVKLTVLPYPYNEDAPLKTRHDG
jgi:photosystem II stability/assembly factor-like uncharacterized protein